MTVELISVGTEILLGDIVNTNAQYLSVALAALGADVMHQSTVGDNGERLLSEIKACLERSDCLILTGGLGPTPDDITKEVAAEAFGLDLTMDEDILSGIESYFKSKKLTMPPTNSKQALVPDGARVLHNRNGTAPGFIMEKEGKAIIILPGPPKEMCPMFEEYVKPYIASRTGSVIISRTVRTFGIGESDMSERVAHLLENKNPTIAPYAKSGEALLRITAKAENQAEAEKLIAPILDEITTILGDYIYGIDCESIEQAVCSILKEKGLTVAFAESCTGGLCAKRITDISGVSEIFHCGVVSYANEIKHRILGVREDTLEKYSAVSENTAREMAEGIRRLSGSDYGVSITGYAGPGDEEEVGLIFIGVSSEKGSAVKRLFTAHRGASCRDYNRHVAASNAFNELRKKVISDSSGQ